MLGSNLSPCTCALRDPSLLSLICAHLSDTVGEGLVVHAHALGLVQRHERPREEQLQAGSFSALLSLQKCRSYPKLDW